MQTAGVDTPDYLARAVVLVEGTSDQRALEALARRRGRSLETEGVSVVPIGGAQAIGRFLERFGPRGLDARLAGLCDAGEESDFRRGLERAGLGAELTRPEMERLGFFVCVADLEDELPRSSFGASWGAAAAARSSMRPCSSTRWTSTRSHGRWIACSLTFRHDR